MEATVFGDGEGEVHEAGAVRLRVLAQAPDQPIAVTDNVVPPGFPGPVRNRHARMTDAFYVLEATLAVDLGGERRLPGPGSFVWRRSRRATTSSRSPRGREGRSPVSGRGA